MRFDKGGGRLPINQREDAGEMCVLLETQLCRRHFSRTALSKESGRRLEPKPIASDFSKYGARRNCARAAMPVTFVRLVSR